jgi:hypothetical protein
VILPLPPNQAKIADKDNFSDKKMENRLEKVFNAHKPTAVNERNSKVLKGVMQVVFVITLILLVFVATYKI